MTEREFVYVTYIEATPERVWEALTSGDFTEQYWGGGRIESDWEVGSPVRHVKHDRGMDWEGEVLEYDPPRRLSYTMIAREGDPPLPCRLPARAERIDRETHPRARPPGREGAEGSRLRLACDPLEPQVAL